MSKSDDNTNELESYGVWVKNSTGGSENPETSADTSDELNLDDGGLDLPDFDDSDFSDMFKDEPQDNASEGLDDFGSEDDTTLSTDELANITDGFEVEQVDAPAEDTELDLGDFDIADSTEAEASEESVTIEDSTDSEEVSVEDSISEDNDEEISLDDFMDGGFSDESVAAGNNGYEPGAEPSASSGTEELSLDDFLDGDSFDSAPDTPKESDTIEDEAPLDMDISFDDSADSVETEDNSSLEMSADDDFDEDNDTVDSTETEEVSMDDFGSGFSTEEASEPVHDTSSDNINTEDIDLSDFGIDADAEETPIVQDVEEAKNKEKVVDYDLSVGNENTATAPVVNEIKEDAVIEEIEEAAPLTELAEDATPVDNSLLQQIVSELSSLKEEMNQLKTNLQEIKTQDSVNPGLAVAAGAAGLAAGAALANNDIDPEKAEEDKGGFFSGDDEDETIALSFDELDNIMNTAEFGDTVEADTNTPEEEPVFEETAVDLDSNNTEIEEIPDTSDDTVIEESIISSEVEADDEASSVDTEIENAISDEKDTSLDDISFDEDQPENFDASDEKLEEPVIDEFIPDGNDELYENEELPDEISIPKSDDLLVESTSSDFMDSVKETTDEEETSAEFIPDESEEENMGDLPSELPDDIEDTSDTDLSVELESEEAPVFDEEKIDEDIPTVDKVINEDTEEETSEDAFSTVESFTEAPASASYAEVDNLDNTLSESNLAYLDKQNAENTDTLANADLKQDIKSVLLYMDQLLENLPEDKIVEFAKSDEFVTYKKLFSELGLS